MNIHSALIHRRALLSSAMVLCFGPPSLALASDGLANSPYRRLTTAQWKARLSPASFDIMRQSGTERPYTSPLLNEHRKGTFVCLGCGLPLFKSDWKYDSHTGWPSFWNVIPGATDKKADFAIGIERTEYHCARCLSHQGHLFDDGPRPTGLRYCNNGVALKFEPA